MLAFQTIRVLLETIENAFGNRQEDKQARGGGAASTIAAPAGTGGLVGLLPAHWQSQIIARRPTRPRRGAETLTAEEIVSLQEAVDLRLGQSKSDNTWSNIASVLNQFELFDSFQDQVPYQMSTLDSRMIMWIEHKIRKQELTRSSPVLYAKKLHQAFKEITARPSPLLRDYIAALRRRPDAAPLGAVAMPLEVFRELLQRVQYREVYAQLLIQWLTASRADDMTRLRRRDIVFRNTAQGEVEVEITWFLGTKGSTIPFTDYVLLSQAQAEAVEEQVRKVRPDEFPFRLGAEEISRIIQNALGNTRYSSHSLKKGALTHLLQLGHSISSVAYKAKHRSTDLLRIYVGPVAWAVAHNAQAMARDLMKV